MNTLTRSRRNLVTENIFILAPLTSAPTSLHNSTANSAFFSLLPSKSGDALGKEKEQTKQTPLLLAPARITDWDMPSIRKWDRPWPWYSQVTNTTQREITHRKHKRHQRSRCHFRTDDVLSDTLRARWFPKWNSNRETTQDGDIISARSHPLTPSKSEWWIRQTTN